MAHIGNFRWAVMMNIATSPFLPTLALRRFLLKRIGINLPSSSYIAAGTTLVSNKITIGEHVLINSQCFLDGAGPIYIEDYVRIGAKVCIITGTHDIENSAIRVDRLKPTVPKAVRIGRGSWLGANVTVLPGVTIGEGCVVAAGAVVTKDLEPHNLYAGIPARQIRTLPQDEATLLEMPRMEQLEFLPPPVTDYDVIGSNLASPA